MAGLLYLPRIFVYHAETKDNLQSETFKTMERKLYNYIMMPAMILSFLTGLLLIHSLGFAVFLDLWMQIKIALVILLSAYNGYLGRCLKTLKNSSNTKSAKFFRIINEIPTVILIIVVFLAIFKPI